MRTRAALVLAAVAATVLPVSLAASRGSGRAQLPARKRVEFSRMAAAPGPAGLKPVRVGRIPLIEPRWRRGVVHSGLAPFSESAFTVANQWQDVVAGRHVSVYAGALGFDRLQGGVVVRETTLQGAMLAPRVYRTPSRTGALRITRARGLLLELRSATGRRYVFAVGTRKLSSAGR